MRIFQLVVLSFSLVFTPSLLWAQSSTQQLRDFIKHVQSAQGQFTQHTVDAQGQSRPEQRGDFAFKRPGKFKWSVTFPYEQLVMADGQSLYQYDPDLNQVTKRSVDQAIGASPAAILFGTSAIEDQFILSELSRAEGLDWLRVKPKNADAGFDYVDIGFEQSQPKQLVVLDGFGQQTRIQLQQIETNVALDAGAFRFTPPANVDMVVLP